MIFGNNTHTLTPLSSPICYFHSQCNAAAAAVGKILIFIIICGKFTDIIKMEDYCNFIQFYFYSVCVCECAIKIIVKFARTASRKLLFMKFSSKITY